MHAGCSGSFANGQQVVDKLRAMGFNEQYFPVPIGYQCTECGAEFEAETLEFRCIDCGMVYGVTPCHAHDPSAIQAAGVGY